MSKKGRSWAKQVYRPGNSTSIKYILSPRNSKFHSLMILTKIHQKFKTLKQNEILHGKCSHSTDECTTFKALIKKTNSFMSKGYKKWSEKTHTNHIVNVLIKKKVEKASKVKNKCEQELLTFEKNWKFQSLRNLGNPLLTAIHLLKVMTAEA